MQKSVENDMVLFMIPSCLCTTAVSKEGKPNHALVVRAAFECETSLENALICTQGVLNMPTMCLTNCQEEMCSSGQQ
jgi:hypothetical protein